jgi:hypothetical protein
MRGQSQAATTRLRTPLPGRRWSTWLQQTKETRRRQRQERIETIARLQAEGRRDRGAGEYGRVPQRLS